MTVDQVELVSRDGTTTGALSKSEAHVAPGQRHRAVSVMVYDADDRILLQRRALGLYHFADRWSNTCCTHPRPGERPLATAQRRLPEEMGIDVELSEIETFRYRAEDSVSGLVENEYVHVFVGAFTGSPWPDRRLVSDWTWADVATLHERLTADPHLFTPWLPKLVDIASRDTATD
jgi:isopentenyl-diphosphate delta-isomerase